MAIQCLGNSDLFFYMSQFMDHRDIPHLRMVCKTSHNTLTDVEQKGKFKQLHFAAGLPAVEGDEYNCRNYVVLMATELSERQIRADYQYIGDPVGPTPLVKKAQIEVLCQDDPNYPGKKKYSTYRGVIIFSAVTRTFGKDLATLDEKNVLTIKSQAPEDIDLEEIKLTIPMSTPNVIELFSHPIKNEKNNCVLSYVDYVDLDYPPECEENSSITFVERKVSENSRNKSAAQQQVNGAPIARFLSLMIPCGFDILKTGTCVHTHTYARTSTTVLCEEQPLFLTLGCYIADKKASDPFGPGVSVVASYGKATDKDGAISEIPSAEVLPVRAGGIG